MGPFATMGLICICMPRFLNQYTWLDIKTALKCNVVSEAVKCTYNVLITNLTEVITSSSLSSKKFHYIIINVWWWVKCEELVPSYKLIIWWADWHPAVSRRILAWMSVAAYAMLHSTLEHSIHLIVDTIICSFNYGRIKFSYLLSSVSETTRAHIYLWL